MDCRVFKSFGGLALSAGHARLYSYDEQQTFFGRNNACSTTASYVPYPPTFALIWAPLSQLGDSVCLLVWSTISIFVFVAGIITAGRAFDVKPSLIFWIIVASLGSVPVWRCVALGQTSLLFSGFLAFFLACWKKKRQAGLALCINLLALKPPLAVLPAILILNKEFRCALVFAMVLAVFLLFLCALLFGFECVVNYPHALLELSKNPPESFHVSDMVNLRGLMASLSLPSGLASLAFAASILVSLYVQLKARVAERGQVCLLVFCTLGLGTHIHLYECTMLAIPALLLLGDESRDVIDSAGSGLSRTLHAALRVLLFFYPIVGWILFRIFYGTANAFFFSAFALMNQFMLLSWIFILLNESKKAHPREDS